MKLDFIIPASPTPAFYSQIALFRLALNRLNGIYRDARLVAVFGDTQRTDISRAWQPHFDQIHIEWADCDAFQRVSYRAQGERRFEVMRPDADLVVLCDADTLLLRPLGGDVLSLAGSDAIGGVIAHYPFPWLRTSGDHVKDWNIVARQTIGKNIQPRYRYSLVDEQLKNLAPFYINLGFLAGAPHALQRLHHGMQTIREGVHELLGNVFDAQVALALAVEKDNLPAVSFPMRYNFPNDPIADRRYPAELASVVLIHYLRDAQFNRHSIFATEAEFRSFLALQLEGSNRTLQDFIRQLTDGRYPF